MNNIKMEKMNLQTKKEKTCIRALKIIKMGSYEKINPNLILNTQSGDGI